MSSCDKRPFASRKAAKRAVGHMHQSVRVYWCDWCCAFHNTKERYDRLASTRQQRKKGRGR